MREKRAGVVVFESIDVTQEQFDQPIFWLLAALLAFMPAAFGSWDPWAEEIALAGACGLALLLAVKLVRRSDVGFVWSWTYLPIALFVLLAAIQLTPLPSAWIAAISPRTVTTNHALLGDLPDAAQRLMHLRLNFYPEEARHDLRNIAAVACVFIVVINVFRRSEQMIQLLWVIAWVGAAEAVLAILQTITSADGVYWFFPMGNRPDGGTFPNHNCFAQFMNLSSGAMLGLLLLKIDQKFRRHDYAPAEVLEKLTSPDFRSAWILAAMLVVSVASVFLSLSRGGMLSIAAAGVLVGALLAVRGGMRGMGIGGWVAGVVLVAVFSLVMAGGANLVEGRIARIGNRDDRFDRLQLSRDAIRAWKDYPAVGMGLGSFRFTFPAYDRSNVSAVASHAENEYVQLLEETGLAGAAIAGSFLLMILANFLRARARGRKKSERNERAFDVQSGPSVLTQHAQPADDGGDSQPAGQSKPANEFQRSGGLRHPHSKRAASPASSLSLGLCFGLTAILLHSAADFGQHCISIASLTSISCALLVNLARLRRQERGLEMPSTVVRGWPLFRIGALTIVLAVSVFLLRQTNQVRLAAAAYERASKLAGDLSSAGWRGDAGDFIDMNRAGDESVRLRPDDMRFRYWRAMNRWYTVSDVHDPVSGDVVLDAAKTKNLREVADDLQEARWICPTFGPLYAQLGQWEQNFLGNSAEGAHLIRIGYELAPGDPTVCFILATLEAEEGSWADSVVHFQRAGKLESSMFADAVDLYVSYFDHPDAAVQLADGDVERLRLVSRKLRALGKDAAAGPTTGPATRPTDEQAALNADTRADTLIRAAADKPDASAKVLGEMGLMCAQTNDLKDACSYLDRALRLNYGQEDWRLVYARTLAKLGNRDDAARQAKIMIRAHAHLSEAQDLIDKLSESPTTQSLLYFLK